MATLKHNLFEMYLRAKVLWAMHITASDRTNTLYPYRKYQVLLGVSRFVSV